MKELQALPLYRKIMITQARIMEWQNHYNGQVCVSFSGGKDSTVLLHIARQMFPDIPAVFSNTGLEYPEIQRFVKSFDNVDIVTPSMNFGEVISTYGYPLIGKEVAEAIYYARRIRPSRERERERSGGNAENSSVNGRTQARGVAGLQSDWKKLELGGRRTTSSRRVQRETEGQFSAGDGKPG